MCSSVALPYGCAHSQTSDKAESRDLSSVIRTAEKCLFDKGRL